MKNRTPKTFPEFCEWLDENASRTIKKARNELIEIVQRMKTHKIRVTESLILNDEDLVVAIRCNLSDRWCPLDGSKAVEFGDKHIEYSKVGKSMRCKKAYNIYFQRYRTLQRQKKEVDRDLLDGKIDKNQRRKRLDEYTADSRKPIVLDVGFATIDECIAYLVKEDLL